MSLKKGFRLGFGAFSGPISLPIKTAFTPFWRRFTDERALETKETFALHQRIVQLWNASCWPDDDSYNSILHPIRDGLPESESKALKYAIGVCYIKCVFLEEVLEAPPEWNDVLSLQEGVALRRDLRAREHFFAHEEQFCSGLINCLGELMTGLMNLLPDFPEDIDDPLFAIPLYTFADNMNLTITGIINALQHEDELQLGLFSKLNRQFYLNVCAVSKQVPDTNHTKPLTLPLDANLPPEEAIEAYLQGTPFYDLYHTLMPLHIPMETFYSHTHIVAGSGGGKTQFLSSLLLHFFKSDTSVVVLDSQGDLISKLSRLDAIKDRLILIDPKDTRHPPAINIFDIHSARLEGYDEQTKEQIVAGAIETLEYLFGGILGSDLTTKQGAMFRFIMRLLISLPDTMGRNATLIDMLDLMEDHAPYADAIAQLPLIARRFFERDFPDPRQFKQTKEQVRYRLNAILENPTMERLFTSPMTKLDLFSELQRGKVILIDTSKEFLKGSSSPYGRIWLSLVMQAIFERAALPEDQRHPSLLVMDEAYEYFDTNIDNILTQLRKYRCGAVFAHQYLGQAKDGLRASLASNTAIKMATRISAADARSMAPDMRTTPEFILAQPKLRFATYIGDKTPHAISVPVEPGKLEAAKTMDEETYKAFRERNRRELAIPKPQAAPKQEDAPEAEKEPPPPSTPKDPWDYDF